MIICQEEAVKILLVSAKSLGEMMSQDEDNYKKVIDQAIGKTFKFVLDKGSSKIIVRNVFTSD